MFSYIEYNIQLVIIKYNKNLQKKLKLSSDDYLDYSENRNKIVIEIIPIQEEYCILNTMFYYNSDLDEDYFHESITYKNGRKIIKLIIDKEVMSFEGLFKNCYMIKILNFVNFYRKDITDMNYMFYKCSSLEEVSFSNKKNIFKTNKVKNMTHMFYGCKSLKKVDLSNINTSEVIDMSAMFFNCSSLEEVNLSNLNNNKLINMNYMFQGCISLKKINLYNFNTENVIKMRKRFFNCKSLEELNLESFNTSKVSDIYKMFKNCFKLKNLILSKYGTNIINNNEYSISDIFKGCNDDLINQIKEKNKNINKNTR